MTSNIYFSVLLLFAATPLAAQTNSRTNNNDTLPSKTVVVTSAFKPSLLRSNKINFSAAALPQDSTRPSLQYQVPSQNLFFAYEPTPLQPLALFVDTSFRWTNHHFVKLGYGNFATPFASIDLSLGDGKHNMTNLHAFHTSSKGNLAFQNTSKSGISLVSILHTPRNEWNGKLAFTNFTQYQYGFQPDTIKRFTDDSLRQRFSNLQIELGFRNKATNKYGINYAPQLQIHRFTDGRSNGETNIRIQAPLRKTIGEIFALQLGIDANLSNYKTDSISGISNNIVSISPAVQYNTPQLKVTAGFHPTWNNNVFVWLPNITAEAKLKNEKFVLLAGWQGYFQKNNYAYLAQVNPFIAAPTSFTNTRFSDVFAGIKGSIGSHFTFNGRLSFQQRTNQALFVNDTLTGKSFNVIHEASLQVLSIRGEIGYSIQEKLQILGGITLNDFQKQTQYTAAYGLLPMQLNGSIRWQLFKDVLVKADVFFWDGAQFRNKQRSDIKMNAAADLNAGCEFAVSDKIQIWAQFNNILNQRYQRWNQYEVLGFNVLGGVIIRFSK